MKKGQKMKFKKVILPILIMLLIININGKCYAKYVFEYTIKAAEISIRK